MTAQISPRMRIVAVGGLVAALLMGAASFLLGRGDGSIADAPELAAALPLPKKSSAKPAAQPQPATSMPVVKKPAPKPPAVEPGLPRSLATALRGSRSVVVLLYVPGAEVDELALAEARAGAGDAGAGFVALDALGAEAAPLAEKLGEIVDAPAVLVFNRPGDVVFTVEGFADRDTVAQAAATALRARP